MNTYRIKSIFGPTIQGEGTHAGTCVLFVRFAGCNRWSGLEEHRAKSFCSFCDTDFRLGKAMSALEIVMELQKLGPHKTVVLSGGEPLLQVNPDLLIQLKNAKFKIHLETNGSRELGPMLTMFDHITMSPKQSPSETKLEGAHALKLLYPLMIPSDWENFNCRDRFLQPITEAAYEDNLKKTLDYIYENPEWKLSLQTHKMIGVQ